jgi:hypothetical protein
MKFKSAAEKRRYEENQKSWEELKAKYATKIKPAKLGKPKDDWSAGVVVPPGREHTSVPSLRTPGGDTALRPSNQYSGSVILGIGLLHKSNYIPIIDEQHAVHIANMRR